MFYLLNERLPVQHLNVRKREDACFLSWLLEKAIALFVGAVQPLIREQEIVQVFKVS